MVRLVRLLPSSSLSDREDPRQQRPRWLRLGLLLLVCFLVSNAASAQLDQCALSLSITPTSPVAFGLPVTVTVTRNFAAMLTVTAPVSLDGNPFCTFTNPFTNPAGNTCPATGTVFNNLSSGNHTVSWTCTVLSDPLAGPPLSGSQTFTVSPQTMGPGAVISPSSWNFGNQLVGTTSPTKSFTLSSTGTAALSISGITTSGDFAQSNNCPASLSPGLSCTINVTFTPTARFLRTGTLSVTDNAADSPQTAALSGTGIVIRW